MSTPNTTAATTAEQKALGALHERLAAAAAEARTLDFVYRIVDSPMGRLLVAATDRGLVRVAFESEGHEHILDLLAQKVGSRILQDPRRLDGVARQFDEYFQGDRHGFDVPLDLQLSTDFRRSVQLELGYIGYGQTMSYAQVAERIGKPTAVRAVGSACATNPLPIVLPCHRVLRSDGSLGGYLGGLAAKRLLLSLENPERGQPADTLW